MTRCPLLIQIQAPMYLKHKGCSIHGDFQLLGMTPSKTTAPSDIPRVFSTASPRVSSITKDNKKYAASNDNTPIRIGYCMRYNTPLE